jgi:short-subunit dehydrogenase
LDISSETSINNLAEWLGINKIKIDVLLNNAGVYDKKDPTGAKCFDYTFATNVYGTVNLTEKVLNENLINKNGKIILLASKLGDINLLKDNLRQEFRKENADLNYLYYLSGKYKKAIQDGRSEEEGWVKECYHVSKMIVNKYATILTDYENVRQNNIQIYSCTPGWVKTDMGGANAPLTLEEGVITPAYLVELDHVLYPELQGKFISDLIPFDIGL